MLELEHFLSENAVDICLLNETHLVAQRALTFANYICHRTNRSPPGGDRVILIHKGIDKCAVPVSELQYLEATAVHLVLATRPVNHLSSYFAPTRPLIESVLNEYPSGGIPVIIAGDSTPNTRTGFLG
jgi:hypothetical protein